MVREQGWSVWRGTGSLSGASGRSVVQGITRNRSEQEVVVVIVVVVVVVVVAAVGKRAGGQPLESLDRRMKEDNQSVTLKLGLKYCG